MVVHNKKKWQTPTIEILATNSINSGNNVNHHEKTITASYPWPAQPSHNAIRGPFGLEVGFLTKNDFIS